MQTQIINSTPFVPIQFESVDQHLNHFGVIVVKGTFDIRQNQPLSVSRDQRPPVLEDTYFGEPGRSSLRFDSCFAPWKPRTDVVVETSSYSPSGQPETQWIAGLEIGPISKNFRMTGPRFWTRRLGVNRLTDIEPVREVDVRYELAFGGSIGSSADERFGENPVGRGFPVDTRNKDVTCPQILPANIEQPIAGQLIAVEGLGPIAPSWGSRLRFAGEFDENWKVTQAPYLPQNFDYEFYNVAPQGLKFPGFAQGDEVVRLTNLSPEHQLSFALPGIELMTVIQFDDGRIIPGPINLDTIELDIPSRIASLTWRGIFPAQIPTRRIEIRMSAPDSMIESRQGTH